MSLLEEAIQTLESVATAKKSSEIYDKIDLALVLLKRLRSEK